MKVLVVGLGSMGKRRIRLLKAIDETIEIIGVDKQEKRREEVRGMGHETFEQIEDLPFESLDFAVVSTAPVTHYSVIKPLLEHNLSVFVELTLVNDGYEELISLAKEKHKTLFLSSTMMYRKEIEYIKKRVSDVKKSWNYVYHVGQYLPDWHPWESYKDFFVADVRTNGCRELFAVELPWIIDTFGEISEIHSINKKITDLELGYPDQFFVTLEHTGGHQGVLVVDVVSPKAIRNLEVYTDKNHIFWEGNPKSLYDFNIKTKEKEFIDTYADFKQDSRYADNIIETAYQDELLNFIEILKGKAEPKYSFEKDLYTIKMMDKIEGLS